MSAEPVVLVGVGQVRGNRDRDPALAREPMDLIADAVQAAAADGGPGDAVLPHVDLVDVVQIVSWTYDDAARTLAARIGATSARTEVSGVGGHQPVARLSSLARRLADGEGRVALLAGGEAQASYELLTKGDGDVPWSRGPGGYASFPREVGGTERMWDLGLVAPIRIYPLFENRLRHDLGQSFDEAQQWSARMYSAFSEVATGNDAAWDPSPLTPDEIATVTPSNRMICWPYPLRMNANNRVDQAGAVLLMTASAADDWGVPPALRVTVRSAAGADDSEDVLDRPAYGSSPGLAATLDRVLDQADVDAGDLDVLDLYSCFPVVPKLAALHLKAVDRPLSVTGGLSSFGGAHNDYSTHALVAAVRALRSGGGTGLVYANGEYLTRHAAVVLSSAPDDRPPVITDPTAPDTAPPAYDADHAGPATVETYTVEFDRDGAPTRAYVVARTSQDVRTAARVSRTDTATLALLTDTGADPVGTPVRVETHGDRRQATIGTS